MFVDEAFASFRQLHAEIKKPTGVYKVSYSPPPPGGGDRIKLLGKKERGGEEGKGRRDGEEEREGKGGGKNGRVKEGKGKQ